MDRIFDLPILLALLGGAVVASALGFAVGLTYQPATAVKRAGEALAVSFLGGFLAHGFVSILLDLGNDSEGAGLLVGWAFFGIPGLIDTPFVLAGGDPILTTPDRLLIIAAVVGAVTGGLHGAYRIYPWRGWGAFQFVLDVTWGLLGSTLGGLMQLYNSFFGTRVLARSAEDQLQGQRLGVVVFSKGFKTGGHNSALTLGSVISNLGDDWDPPLVAHERTHVLQNRLFGPLFTLTYAAWMVVMFVPALIGNALADDTRKGGRVWGWCYASNPWEVWGYAVHSRHAGRTITTSARAWSTLVVGAVALPFFVATGLTLAAVTTRTLLA